MSDKNKKTLGSKTEKETKIMGKISPLSSRSEKEMELESALSAAEKAAYDRLDKQGMSDQGIVSPKQLKEAATKVAGKVKEKAKKAWQSMTKGASKDIKEKK